MDWPAVVCRSEGIQPFAGGHGFGMRRPAGAVEGLVASEEERSGLGQPAARGEAGAELALGVRQWPANRAERRTSRPFRSSGSAFLGRTTCSELRQWGAEHRGRSRIGAGAATTKGGKHEGQDEG